MQSAEKKLAGAAQTSFMKKCETDAKAACDKQAADKKLAGAAKTSFTKKCVKRRRRHLIRSGWPACPAAGTGGE